MYEIEQFDLENYFDFMDFISIKVKTTHVLEINEFLFNEGFDYSAWINELFPIKGDK